MTTCFIPLVRWGEGSERWWKLHEKRERRFTSAVGTAGIDFGGGADAPQVASIATTSLTVSIRGRSGPTPIHAAPAWKKQTNSYALGTRKAANRAGGCNACLRQLG